MDFSINIKITSSPWFIGILAELNGVYTGWSDGSYDWADQTTDFLSNLPALPQFDPSLFKTPLSQKLMQEVTQIVLALVRGDYRLIREYLKDINFIFVIGYPRTGGSYLTKSILQLMGVDHKKIPEPLAHDSFPNLLDSWYDLEDRKELSYFYESYVQLAEFLVLSKNYCQMKLPKHKDGKWLMVKKMHKAVYAGHGLRMLFNPGQADYLLTFRNPLPVAISVYEKSGGLPEDGLFPAKKQRSAIEMMMVYDLMMEGYTIADISKLDYYQVVEKSWIRFYSKLATSGLFSNNKENVKMIPYEKNALEEQVKFYQNKYKSTVQLEKFYVHDKAQNSQKYQNQANETVNLITKYWKNLGLNLPELDCL